VGPPLLPPFRGDLLTFMLFPEVDFNFGKPSPKSPPIPGNLGALEADELLLLPLFEAAEDDEPAVRLLFALAELLLLFAVFPPNNGPDLSFVTVFFKAFPCCIDLSKSPRSCVPPPDDLGLETGGGLGGPAGAGGGPGGGGGGGILLLASYTSQFGMPFNWSQNGFHGRLVFKTLVKLCQYTYGFFCLIS